MAIPLNRPKTPPEPELRKIFKNPRLFQAMKDLFDAVPGDFNRFVQDLEIMAGAADSKAIEALQFIKSLGLLAELAALSPPIGANEEADDVSPPVALSVVADDTPPPSIPCEEADDVSPPFPEIAGASGTFTTADPYTVTVVNGIITDIS